MTTVDTFLGQLLAFLRSLEEDEGAQDGGLQGTLRTVAHDLSAAIRQDRLETVAWIERGRALARLGVGVGPDYLLGFDAGVECALGRRTASGADGDTRASGELNP